MREEILLECLECKDNYIGTTHIDGYNCPRCGGIMTGVGVMKKLEESGKEIKRKIRSAKWNGDIKNHYNYLKAPKPKQPPVPNKYICGADFGSGKDLTVLNIKDNDIVVVRVGCLLPETKVKEIEAKWESTFKEQGFNNIKVIVLHEVEIQVLSSSK